MRIRALYAPALVGVLAIAACAPPPPATSGTAADETAIRAIGSKYADAWNKGDIPALSALVTEDYEAVAPDGTAIKGRAANEEMEKKQLAARTGLPLKLSVDTTYVHWAGANAASVGGTWSLAGVPAGMGADKGAWTMLSVKGTDGQWRLATGLVAEYVPPPAMPMPPPPAKGKGK